MAGCCEAGEGWAEAVERVQAAGVCSARCRSRAPCSSARSPWCPHPPAVPLPLRYRQVAGQYILKPGDEVAFVLHTNLKSGELNAQRVRRTKEGPELPEPGARRVLLLPAGLGAACARRCAAPAGATGLRPRAGPHPAGAAACPEPTPTRLLLSAVPRCAEPAPRREKRGGAGGGEEAVPAVNPNRVKYSGNLTTGGYKQPKIAKGPGAWQEGGARGCLHCCVLARGEARAARSPRPQRGRASPRGRAGMRRLSMHKGCWVWIACPSLLRRAGAASCLRTPAAG